MASTTPATLADPWNRAKAAFLRELEPAEQRLFDNATLENIYSTTNNANQQDAENSKTRDIIQKLRPLILAIENYGSALDTFAQIAPLYLSPIWGSIRVVLATARSHAKLFEKIVDTLSRIGYILPRFRDYERIYDCEKHQRLMDALSDTYLDIIIICTNFRQYLRDYQASSFRRIFKPLSLNRHIEDAVERFCRHKDKVNEEAGHCHMIEAAEQRNKELVLAAAERRRKLLSKLSNVDCRCRHHRLKESRHEGTGVWLAARPEYQQWEELDRSSVLCCYGIPGCGKSVLASSIFDSLRTTRPKIFYYCDYADKRTLDPSNMFGTLARQLLENIDPISEDLALQIEHTPQNGDRIWNAEDALKLLLKTIYSQNQPLFMFLDGLDEVSEENQKVVYQGLREILITTPVSIKLFITGREEVASQLKLAPSFCCQGVFMSSTSIMHDIESYICASTKRRISDGSLVIQDPTLEKQIVERLVTGAKGMFLWVEFQLNELCEAESDHGIKVILQNLPRNLSETYKRLLDRIEGAERKTMILRLFKWIVCARKPMRVDELREGVAFTLYDEEWVQNKIPTNFKRLFRACGNLVIVDEETQIVKLAHYTVQQYLLKPNGTDFSFTLKEANVMAGQICIAYLNFSNFGTQVIKYKDNASSQLITIGKLASHGQLISHDNPAHVVVHAWNTWRGPPSISKNVDVAKLGLRKAKMPDLSHFTLLEYVKSHWFWHTSDFQYQLVNKNQPETLRQLHLFNELTFNHDLLFECRPWGESHRERSPIAPGRILACALDSNHAYLAYFLSRERQINTTGMILTDWNMLLQKYKITSRPWKFPKGLVDNIDLLINDIPSAEPITPGWLCSKIISASRNDWVDVIHASTSYRGVGFTTIFKSYLLLEAAAYGAVSVVIAFSNTIEQPWDFCVEHGNGYLNPLEIAILEGQLTMVKCLWDAGSRIQNLIPSANSFFELLIDRTDNGNLQALETLFYVRDQGILFQNLSLEVAQIKQLMMKAVQLGSAQVTETLLRHLLHSTGPKSFCDVLATAIHSSNLEIIDLLLRHFCSNTNEYYLPLTLAACSGNLDIVELTLKYYPNAALISSSSTMLWYYSPGGKLDHFYYDLCPTPLYMACYHGYLPIVKTLIRHGASFRLPSPQKLVRLKYSASTSELSMLGTSSCLSSFLTGSSFQDSEYSMNDSDGVHWETPLALISRIGDKGLSIASSCVASSLNLSTEVVDCVELPLEFSIVVKLLSHDFFWNSDNTTVTPIFEDLVQEGRERLSPNHYDEWAPWLCQTLDDYDGTSSLQNVIIYLSPDSRKLLRTAMAQTIQKGAYQRVQKLRKLNEDCIYYSDPFLVKEAQCRIGREFDELRDILISEGILAVRRGLITVLKQIIRICITYSPVSTLSVEDYAIIFQRVHGYDVHQKYPSKPKMEALEDFFTIFAFPNPGSTPLEDALKLAKSVGASVLERIIGELIDNEKSFRITLSDLDDPDMYPSTVVPIAEDTTTSSFEIEKFPQGFNTILEAADME